MNQREAYAQKLQTRLDEFSAEIDRLKARADKAEEPWHRQQIEVLQEKHRQAKQKLAEFRDAGDNAWEDMKEGMTAAWDAISMSVKSAAQRFE